MRKFHSFGYQTIYGKIGIDVFPEIRHKSYIAIITAARAAQMRMAKSVYRIV